MGQIGPVIVGWHGTGRRSLKRDDGAGVEIAIQGPVVALIQFALELDIARPAKQNRQCHGVGIEHTGSSDGGCCRGPAELPECQVRRKAKNLAGLRSRRRPLCAHVRAQLCEEPCVQIVQTTKILPEVARIVSKG